jgi:hypothetical protein
MRANAIRRARVPARLAGAPRLRPVLERWLAEHDLARHGFPPRAIVLVRRLAAPWADVAAGDGAARYRALGHVLAAARRPALGQSGAEAVWFEDEAELLACLGRDAAAGALDARWWWRLVLDGSAARAGAVARWVTMPRAAPRALRRLDPPVAQAWLASWAPDEQAGMLDALARAFPIAPAVAAWVRDGTPPDESGTTIAPVSTRGAPRANAVAPAAGSRAERLRLLCEDLAGDPGVAAEPVHATRLAARLASEAAVRPRAAPRPLDAPAAASDQHGSHHRARPCAPVEAPGRVRAGERPAGPGLLPPAPDEPASPPPRTAMPRPAEREIQSVTSGPLADQPAATDPGRAAAPASSGAAFDTRYGGLLFLLNVALRLSLYGDFSRSLDRGLACTPWRFLWLAGRAWAGRAFLADPLAAWLSARSPRGPAARAAEAWRLPVSWLTPFAGAAGPWYAVWRGARLRIGHPAGFTLLYAPATPDQCAPLVAAEIDRLGLPAAPPVRHAMARGGPCRCDDLSVLYGCPPALWTYLAARLALALGVADAPRRRRRLERGLLRLPARVLDTGDRLDVHLALDALPLMVRRAGLDRDPGWIPAAGCDVRFHFS